MSREEKIVQILRSVWRLQDQLILAKGDMKEDSRRAAYTALKAVIDFISSIPGSNDKGLANPLTTLRMALLDLGSGTIPPLLTPPSKVMNRPKSLVSHKFRKAYAIASVDRLMAAGMRVDEACKFVSAEYRRAKIDIGTRTDQWKTVRQWRYELKRRSSDDPTTYDLVQDFNRVLKPASTKEQTKRELRQDIAENMADFK
jgi:hypothetical protein